MLSAHSASVGETSSLDIALASDDDASIPSRIRRRRRSAPNNSRPYATKAVQVSSEAKVRYRAAINTKDDEKLCINAIGSLAVRAFALMIDG